MSRDHDYLFKVAIVGNSSVGKSSILRRYADDTFTESYLATIGVDFRFKTLTVDGKSIKLQIWDTAGQQRFRTITSTYYKGAQCIFLVYDIHNKKSFNDVQNFWKEEVVKYGQQNVEICVLGNKIDLDQGRQVYLKQASQYCQSQKLSFYQVSAKTGDQISEAFQNCIRHCMKKFPPFIADQQINIRKQLYKKRDQIKLVSGKDTKDKKCC